MSLTRSIIDSLLTFTSLTATSVSHYQGFIHLQQVWEHMSMKDLHKTTDGDRGSLCFPPYPLYDFLSLSASTQSPAHQPFCVYLLCVVILWQWSSNGIVKVKRPYHLWPLCLYRLFSGSWLTLYRAVMVLSLRFYWGFMRRSRKICERNSTLFMHTYISVFLTFVIIAISCNQIHFRSLSLSSSITPGRVSCNSYNFKTNYMVYT